MAIDIIVIMKNKERWVTNIFLYFLYKQHTAFHQKPFSLCIMMYAPYSAILPFIPFIWWRHYRACCDPEKENIDYYYSWLNISVSEKTSHADIFYIKSVTEVCFNSWSNGLEEGGDCFKFFWTNRRNLIAFSEECVNTCQLILL